MAGPECRRVCNRSARPHSRTRPPVEVLIGLPVTVRTACTGAGPLLMSVIGPRIQRAIPVRAIEDAFAGRSIDVEDDRLGVACDSLRGQNQPRLLLRAGASIATFLVDDAADALDDRRAVVGLRCERQEAGAIAEPRAIIAAIIAIVLLASQQIRRRRKDLLGTAAIAQQRQRRSELAHVPVGSRTR